MIQRLCKLLKIQPPAPNEGLLFASGTAVPSDGTYGYQIGCLFQHTDGGANTSLYVNEGSLTSCDFNVVSATTLGATAGTVTASKAVIVDAYKTLRWGGFNTGAALTDCVNFATVPDTWTDGQLDVLSVFSGSGADKGSGYSAKAARFRHVILTSAGTIAHETYGAVGQLVVRGTTLTHLHSGLLGTFEGHTSGAVCNSTYTRGGHAAITARLGGHAAITATTPVSGFLAFNNASAALAGGRSQAFTTSSYSATYPWTIGLCMPVGSVLQAVRIGDWVAAGATGSAIPFATAQNLYSDGQLNILAVFGESSSDLTSAYAATTGRFRHLVSGSSTTIAHETYGLQGQLVAKSVTLTHLHSGLMGTFEANTTAVTLNSSYTSGGHACVIARLGGHALITATTPIAGFLAFNNASAALASGKSVAFSTCAAGSYPWSVGLGIRRDTAAVPIRIGNWVASGQAGSGMLFSTAQNYDSDGQLGLVSVFGECSSNLTSAYNAHCGRFRHLVTGSSTTIAQETYGLIGQVVVKSVTLTHLHSGLLGTFEGNTTAVTSTPAYRYGTAGVMSRVGGLGIVTASTPLAGFSAVFNGVALLSGTSCAYAITNTSTGEFDYVLGVTHAGSGAHNGVNIASITSAPTDGSADGVLRIDIGGTPYYVLLHAAANLDGE